MSRLIDADLLKRNIAKWLKPLKPDETETIELADVLKSVVEEIDEQPTAFDVDEVVQQLEILIEDKCSESGDDWYTAECLNEAVEIVKSGGIKWVD
jgi:hypothetical protein|nr:MAG TPA: hypothetical protein [Caudoviricetes sp.]